MEDLIYVVVLLAFFAVAGLFVVACDRIIGPDEAALTEGGPEVIEPEPEITEVAA